MEDPKITDVELVARFKEGDRKAFDELFQRYKARLVHVAMRITGDSQAAEEVTHEAFLEIYRRPGQFHGESQFYTYIYRITVNRAKNYIRSRIRKREVPLAPDEGEQRGGGEGGTIQGRPPVSPLESAREIHDKGELTRLLQEALNQLPEITRQAFVLTEIEELRYEEAAKTLNISAGTVGWHVHEARKRLRKLLPLELLQIFYFAFRIENFHEEVWFGMGIMFENIKLVFGLPSSLLLSYYADGETNPWQRRRIEELLATNNRFKQEYGDYQKIQTLFGQIEVPELSPDFDLEFERKLREITTEDRGLQTDD